MTLESRLEEVKKEEQSLWDMVKFFMDKRDAHGVMDMGSELEAIQRVKKELQDALS